MKKCGILTWHYLDNYGSFLQAYAMLQLFKNKNISTKLINYRAGAKTGFINELLRKIKYFLPALNSYQLRKKKFYLCRKKYLNETKMCSNKNELKKIEKFDFYVCGSDQIWAANRFDETYFFDFLERESLYSYAPSTVIDLYNEKQKKKVSLLLNKFKKISVRENKGVEILKKITNKDVVEVLDPTLLLDKKQWLVNQKKVQYKDYVLCYLIGDECKYNDLIIEYAKKNNKKIINICICENQKFGDIILESLDPFEFLSLINSCFCFFTDSFHGVLFSINFNIEFYALKRFSENEKNNQNARIVNILEKVGLIERFIDSIKQIDDKCINYNIVNKILEGEKQKSISFINSIKEEVCQYD